MARVVSGGRVRVVCDVCGAHDDAREDIAKRLFERLGWVRVSDDRLCFVSVVDLCVKCKAMDGVMDRLVNGL